MQIWKALTSSFSWTSINTESHYGVNIYVKQTAYLAYHPVPCSIDLLPMFAIGYQIKVIGELDKLRDFLENINAKPFAAFLHIGSILIRLVPNQL